MEVTDLILTIELIFKYLQQLIVCKKLLTCSLPDTRLYFHQLVRYSLDTLTDSRTESQADQPTGVTHLCSWHHKQMIFYILQRDTPDSTIASGNICERLSVCLSCSNIYLILSFLIPTALQIYLQMTPFTVCIIEISRFESGNQEYTNQILI